MLFLWLVAAVLALAIGRSQAGPQRDSICQGCGDGPGCTPCGSSGGWNTSSSNPGIAWGGMTKRNMQRVGNECGNKPLCYVFNGAIGLFAGVLTDVPYYAVKGVGYGLYYGGKGLGKGIGYTGRAIGRGLAYPFNRPPKPILPPTTWEQYKHDVIRLQKRLTKADKTNKANQRWCVSRVPLSASANRSEWEARCNPGDAVSRASLPPDVLATATAVVETATVSASPAPATVIDSPASASPSPPASPADRAGVTPPSVAEDAAALPIAAPPAGDPVSATSDAKAPETTAAQDGSQQQSVQTGVAPQKAALDSAVTPSDKASAGFSDGKVAIIGTTPAALSQGTPLRTLPSGTPANSLTPSEYGFEGRGGYPVKYNQVWGPATPAESFIEKWNPIQTLTSIRKSINETLRDRGTPFAKETAWEKAKDMVADLLKRIRGSTNIVDRTKGTQAGRNVVQSYSEKLLEDDMALLNAAADGKAEHLLEANEERMNRSYSDLKKDAVENTMGQVGDPLETVKEHALEKTKEVFPNAAPRNKAIEESTIYHWADDFGNGGSKAKVVH